ncbi:MAG: leucine-rich repeat protein [Clostridia bacterium]|nr:leucine-rich repeat protein [Clostridia bacterium]
MKKTYKLIALILSAIMLLSALPVISFTAFADEPDFKLAISDGGATVTGLTDKNFTGDLEIPSVIDERQVLKIGNYAFKDYKGISSVTISDGITEITQSAFSGCTALESVVIPDSVTKIGNCAFEGCSALKSITIPDSVATLGTYAFSGCTALQSIAIGSGITEIIVSDFSECKSLTSVTIPGTVKSIGNSAFAYCDNLTSVVIEDGVEAVYYNAFSDCAALKKITMPDSVITIGSDAFENTAWYDGEADGLEYIGKVAYKYKGTCPESITVKDETLGIAQNAFSGSEELASITIPDSVKLIGGSAFANCTALKNVTLNEGVEIIGIGAFSGCKAIKSITVPNSVKEIGIEAFAGCTALKSITIPSSVKEIGASAFEGCTALKSVTLPKGIKKINLATFSECSLLENVTIPSGVTEIVYAAFCGCSKLNTIDMPKSVKKIESWSFFGCEDLKDVYYTGKKAQKSSIYIDDFNGPLKNATWHYESEKVYSIEYKLNGGKNGKNPKTYTVKTDTITLKNPTKKGYKFKGWYSDANFKNKVKTIKKGSTGNKTLHAKWSKINYKITYKLNKGKNNAKSLKSYTVTTSATLKKPTRKGYTFKGWYSDAKFKNKVTKIKEGSTGDITLYAKWSKATYKITYKLNKGKNNSKNPKKYTVTTATVKLKNPTRKGYTFKGWYSDSKFKNKVTKIVKGSTGNKTLYAKWAKK